MNLHKRRFEASHGRTLVLKGPSMPVNGGRRFALKPLESSRARREPSLRCGLNRSIAFPAPPQSTAFGLDRWSKAVGTLHQKRISHHCSSHVKVHDLWECSHAVLADLLAFTGTCHVLCVLREVSSDWPLKLQKLWHKRV